jgi:hypothetical protein
MCSAPFFRKARLAESATVGWSQDPALILLLKFHEIHVRLVGEQGDRLCSGAKFSYHRAFNISLLNAGTKYCFFWGEKGS